MNSKIVCTNVDIDDELMAETLKASGYKTTKAPVEEGVTPFYCRSFTYKSNSELALRP